VQSYLFDKEKWTLEKAKAWFEQHHRETRHEHFCYVTPILEKIVDKPLKIRGVALTAGMSRNLNIYTPEELQNFASKMVGSPVYLEHVSAFDAIGKVTKADWNPDSKTLSYEAEIYDDETAEKIRKGLIQHVSVGADYERIDILDGKVPHGLHNAELSLVAVPGIPETNVQIVEKLKPKEESEPKTLEDLMKLLEERFAEVNKRLDEMAKPKPPLAEAERDTEQKETKPSEAEKKSLAEELLKQAPVSDPNLIDKREILRLLPEERVVRSWSYGPRLLVHQLRYKLSTSGSSKLDRE